MEDLATQQQILAEEKRKELELARNEALIKRRSALASVYQTGDEDPEANSEDEQAEEQIGAHQPALPATRIIQSQPPPPPPRAVQSVAPPSASLDITSVSVETVHSVQPQPQMELIEAHTQEKINNHSDGDNLSRQAPPRHTLALVEEDAPVNHNVSPQEKILLDMENLLILINVWRDSEFGRKILAERGVTIDPDLRKEMDQQFNKLKGQMRELELCIVDLFSKSKNGQGLNDNELQKILNQIKSSDDPSTSYFRNTLLNFLNPIPIADNICLPKQLFSYTNRHTVNEVKYNLRRHIIYKHKFYFEKYDESVMYNASPNTSAQRASYNIQNELIHLANDRNTLDQLDNAQNEEIQNVVTGIIGKHLGLAGSIPVWFKKDSYFAKTLDIIARFNNHIDKIEKTGFFKQKEKILPLEKLFLRNPLIWLNREFNNQLPRERYITDKRHELTATILMIANYYLNTPLGMYFAEIHNIEENAEFGQKDHIKKLKHLAEKLAFNPIGDIEAMGLLINEIKTVIKSIWSSNSRTKNELILLVEHFGSAADKEELPKLSRIPKRFGNKNVFNYQMDKKEVDRYYQLHFSQELTKKLSYYHATTSKRTRVKTAVCKDEAMWDLEKCINEIYMANPDDIQKQISNLPNKYDSNLTGLIHYRLQQVFDNNIPRNTISEQGQFAKTWHKVQSYFKRMTSGKIQKNYQDRSQYPREVAHNSDNHRQNPRPISVRNLVLDKTDFYVLSARLLAVINAYCCTDLAAEMYLELNEDDKGQKEHALALANNVVELFLKIKPNSYDSDDQEKAALNELKQEITRVSGLIKESWFGSRGSRFAKSLDELIKSKNVNLNAGSLPFNAAKSIKLFPDENTDDAKRMIHRHMVDQVCTHYVDFEQNIQGKLSDQPGEFEQKAAAETRKRLKSLSHMNLADQNQEINKLEKPDANMRDVIIAAVAKPIVRCGIVTRRFGHQFNNLLQAACRSIKKFSMPDQEEVHVETLLVPGLAARNYVNDNGQDIHNPEKNMFKLLGSIQIICKYYLDDNLGRQYADALQFPHHKKHGWDDDVLQLLRLAEHLYLRNKNDGESDDDYIKNNMTLLLEKMNTVIDKIRGSLSKDSSFANELISLMNRYGGVYRISTGHQVSNTRYKEGQLLIDPARLTVDQAEDFMQLNLIQKVFTELSYFRATTDMHGSVHSGDSSAFLQMEKNLDNLYNMTIEQRRAEIARLPNGQENIVSLIKRYIPHNVPYNFISPNSYLRKGAINAPIERIYKYFDEVRKPIVEVVNNVRPQVLVN